MDTEVEHILTTTHRPDLLTQYYTLTDQWEPALSLSSTHDRIALRATFYKFARWLEEKGDETGAIAAFEKSGVFSVEVPRMILKRGGDVGKFVAVTEDKALRKWYAQYSESHGDFSTALKYYELAEDTLSVVRVLCQCEDLAQARAIAEKTNNPAAFYHIARQCERDGQ
ncbi:hypothetical protein HK104_008017, partial [Borealophlyctis nickersoniae]